EYSKRGGEGDMAMAGALTALSARIAAASQGPNNVAAVGRYINAGSLLMDMERPTEALTMARYALDAYMSEYGEDDPLTSVWAGNLLRMALTLKVDLEEDRDDLLRLLVADEAKTLSAA